MKLYSAKIRLAGNTDNEVIRHNMSAAELHVLEFIHAGKNAVLTDVKYTGDVNRTDARERQRLAQEYSKSTRDGFMPGVAIMEKLFGIATLPLPAVYEAPKFEPVETFDVEGEGENEVITPAPEPVLKKSMPTKLDELTG